MLLALAIAFGGGAWSVDHLLSRFEGSGFLTSGPWHADRLAGSPTADPYSRARTAREGNLILGLGEGVAFRAGTDSAYRPLRADCTYRIEGQLPIARLYTLTTFRPDGRPAFAAGSDRPGTLISSRLMRDDANAAPIIASAGAQPGNWLALPAEGSFVLSLTLYDTPASSSAGVGGLTLPSIERVSCRG
ncbi:DUF1214 domain-containing protein [Aureimonas frigidaquae]|uniref:DUF1214 domain-containing protein n=1 Tax=Aureimonas frigidaquae TaxID=424757 RepID=UPI001FCD1978|nr:DUF1214 domain-containing protein [Aureimonas frigidaquae]